MKRAQQTKVIAVRVETKIFVFVFSRKFIFAFREKSLRKLTKITKIFEKNRFRFNPNCCVDLLRENTRVKMVLFMFTPVHGILHLNMHKQGMECKNATPKIHKKYKRNNLSNNISNGFCFMNVFLLSP
jgi:hypothetical protein